MAKRRRVQVHPAPGPAPAPTSPEEAQVWEAMHLVPLGPNDRAPLALTGLSGNRADAWVNVNTGAGTSRDKARSAQFCSTWVLADDEITALYNEDDVAATIVDLPIDEMFRRGFHIRNKGGDADVVALRKAADKVFLFEKVIKGAKWGRAYGGGVVFVAWNDGQNPALPLNPDRIDKKNPILYVKDFDRRFAVVNDRDNDPLSPTFGDALTFSVGLGNKVIVHASRCIRFEGAQVDEYTRYSLLGWTTSVLQRPYVALQQFSQAYLSIGNLITDASQGVFKLKNLIQLMSTQTGAATVIRRMQSIDTTRSSSRAIVLDADGEDFEREATPLHGIPELLEAFQRRLSTATRIPVTLLMGEAPAGLQATGDSDIRFFYDSISRQQPHMGRKMMQALGPLATCLGIDPESLDIEWLPLWELTDAERATTDLANAQRDVALITAGVWEPEQVALSRASGITTTTDTEVDTEHLQSVLAENLAHAKALGAQGRLEAKNPPPVVAPGQPGDGPQKSQAGVGGGAKEPSGRAKRSSKSMGQTVGAKERKA
jgi:phage-related protein (TIGR01555 family)